MSEKPRVRRVRVQTPGEAAMIVERARRAFTTNLMQQDAFGQTVGECEVYKFRAAMYVALGAIGIIPPTMTEPAPKRKPRR